MKKFVITFIMMTLVVGLVPLMLPITAEAQKMYARRVVGRNGRVRYVRTRKPSFYRRHRNRVNMAVGTGAGALIGGLIGGRKGALIGGAAGLGGSALYTYKLRPKKKKYVRIKRY
ncbi:MAG: hypothetical protein JWN60_43 [Acidobacteria bacterium]|jgi:hypothetical protein|nr:hypothetical protein [Acidobacteriota bacterium]